MKPSCACLPVHSGDHLVQRRGLPVLDIETHLDVSAPRQTEPERADAREAAVALADGTRHLPRGVEVVAGEIDVEGDQRRTRPDEDATRPLVELRRTEVGSELAGVDAPLQLHRAAAPEERRPAVGREVAVEEDRQRELRSHPSRQLESRSPGARRVRLANGDDRNDVGGADAGVRALVPAQVDPLAGAGNARQERGDELLLIADERVDRAVVILVRVDVEQARVRRERLADRFDGRAVAPLGEVRDGLERQHRGGAYAPGR